MTEDRRQRIDRLFDIGLVLITVISAAELQYTSVKRVNEVNFAFRLLTIPIIILIVLWLIKELIPNLFAKMLIIEFCWPFLGHTLALNMLSFVILTFYTTLFQLVSFLSLLVIFSFFLSVAVIWEYIKCEPESRYFRSRVGLFLWTIVGPGIGSVLSYLILSCVIQISALPGP